VLLIGSYYTGIPRCTVNKTLNSYFCVSVNLQHLGMAYSCVVIRHMNGIQFKWQPLISFKTAVQRHRKLQ